MLMIVNAWDGNRTINVDFTPFRFGFGATRYLVNDTWLKTALLPDQAGETITLASGETVVYVFPNTNGSTGLDNVTFQPVPPLGNSKMSITYGYLYQENVAAFGNAVDCANGCVVPVDRRLGDVFFQYTFVDPAISAKRTGALTPLGQGNSISINPPPRY
jgi:hypothetical protein